jgi:hypothetical protein
MAPSFAPTKVRPPARPRAPAGAAYARRWYTLGVRCSRQAVCQ